MHRVIESYEQRTLKNICMAFSFSQIKLKEILYLDKSGVQLDWVFWKIEFKSLSIAPVLVHEFLTLNCQARNCKINETYISSGFAVL